MASDAATPKAPDTPKVARASAPPLSSGRVIGGKFEITGVLGEGGTGIVYEARRLGEGASDEPLALKVIHGHLLFDKQIRGRFTREAKILSRLSGPNLCPVLDYGELPDPRGEGANLVYIALPKIVGPPLDQVLREKGVPTIERALEIVIQVCTALASAHAQGVIHRDLKPANVLLKDGKNVVVVDFGMAKILTGGGTGTTGLTAHNMVFGTPEYMAPEQARGDELDARCDIYAVGVMLYELVTGKVPFIGNTPLNVLTAQLTEPPKRPRERAPERQVSAALEAVIMHALAKDPRDRYPTAAAFAVAIAHAEANPEDVEGVAPDRAAVGAGVQLVRPPSDDMVHAPTLPGPTPPAAASRPAIPSFTPAPESSSRVWLIVWAVAVSIGIAVGVWLSLRAS